MSALGQQPSDCADRRDDRQGDGDEERISPEYLGDFAPDDGEAAAVEEGPHELAEVRALGGRLKVVEEGEHERNGDGGAQNGGEAKPGEPLSGDHRGEDAEADDDDRRPAEVRPELRRAVQEHGERARAQDDRDGLLAGRP